MSAVRLRQIGRYLRPHRRQVALGAGALLVVNLLGVAIPLQVRNVVNGLQEGFSLEAVLRLYRDAVSRAEEAAASPIAALERMLKPQG